MEPINIFSKVFIELSQISPLFWLFAGIAGAWCYSVGRLGFALKILYFLAVYQMFISNKFYWIDYFGGQPMGFYAYIVSATAMVLLGVFSLFRESY